MIYKKPKLYKKLKKYFNLNFSTNQSDGRHLNIRHYLSYDSYIKIYKYNKTVNIDHQIVQLYDLIKSDLCKIKQKIVSQIEIDIPTFTKNKLPTYLKSIAITKPGSRYIR